MKRYIVFIICALSVNCIMAQTTANSKQYLPDKGEYSIAIDVTPVLNYVGNFFNNTANNTLDNIGGEPITSEVDGFNIDNIAPDVSIIGKYMLTDQFALKANIGLMMRRNTTRTYVTDDVALLNNPLSEAKVIDIRNINRNGLSALLGAEYRTGSKRIQGVFGAGLLLGCNKSKTTYNYGNEMNVINQTPTIAYSTYTSGYRTLISKSASNIFFGATASVGVECFIAPKIALGAEVNIAAYYVRGGQEYVTSEGYNNTKGVVESRCDTKSPGNRSFRLGTDNLGSALYMAFYF